MIVGKWFQVLFTPLSAVLFTFPSRYLFTIDLGVVFSLGWWSTHISVQDFSVVPGLNRQGRSTLGSQPTLIFGLRGLINPLMGLDFPKPISSYYYEFTIDSGYSHFARHYFENLF